ncbi:hypothetical protein SEA_KIPPER29_94 [Mycobacterium phage Kipper29]|uniref:Uncharacterized protein n=6 Tax=Caudoviricetes TaxID=2731619 RepID=G1EBW4_9CAUD|nr:hypothetical protein AXJ19_gp018 [Mycobacterium phage VohminGhazi]YP_009637896.1 hypothetical protein FGG32_gp017 [Mycobacterium phage EricB]YP_010061219.1 hypothetical protein KIP54_gp17 [Mycobacterium phage JewelBug]AEK08535.1 hypothetical protein PBI_DAVINCI_92 [Mycobacterium phage DaVinci]AMQ66928.1 hypothetical protein PBI_MCFLY_94 [Mycobacterium phage McFly]AMW64443.1 hypothetical protein PBI_KAZAN_95 [Mycobacterium phage Kazan]AVP42212.1 hypothetical protein SEA_SUPERAWESOME_94 [Myc
MDQLTNSLTFKSWLGYVDAHMYRRYGVTHDDVADQTWWDWWNDGVSPVDAAQEAFENGFW